MTGWGDLDFDFQDPRGPQLWRAKLTAPGERPPGGAVVGAGGIADTDQPGGAGVLEVKPYDEGGEERGPLLDELMVFARRVLSMSCLAEIAPESFGWLLLFC
jgi:hypothetical protein